jgi:hypothetical protein
MAGVTFSNARPTVNDIDNRYQFDGRHAAVIFNHLPGFCVVSLD